MHTLNRSQKLVSTKSVKNTHNYARLRELHGALLEIISVMNRPQRGHVLGLEGLSLRCTDPGNIALPTMPMTSITNRKTITALIML